MKKIVVPFVLATLFAAVPVLASPTDVQTIPGTPSEIVPLGPAHEQICRDAIGLQESRIRDVRAAIEYDKGVEAKLLEGVRAREEDAAKKQEWANRWRQAAQNADGERRRNAFNTFASWLDGEAANDRRWANERREAARIINKGWNQQAEAIKGHEHHLQELHRYCDRDRD